MSAESDRQWGRIFAVAAYALPAGMAWLAHANAGPATGGPMPPTIWDQLAMAAFLLAPFCGLMAYVYGRRVASGGIKFFGGLAFVLSLILLALFFWGASLGA